MWSQSRIAAVAAALAFGACGPGAPAASAQTSPDRASPPSSQTGPASGNTGAANNGVGAKGSLDHNAGTASSTVEGVKGGQTPFGGSGGGSGGAQGAGGPMETDPTQGGGKPH